MRYPPDHKAKARDAILQAAAASLRVNGFNGIGVDGLAAAAGVTSGAFYSNFPGKEALLEGVIEAALGKSFVDATGSLDQRRALLKTWLDQYLSDFHRENPALGCVMPSLSADVARAGAAVRAVYRAKMADLVAKVASVLGGDPAGREDRAWSLVAMMVGAISIARAMPDGADAQRALRATRDAALALIA